MQSNIITNLMLKKIIHKRPFFFPKYPEIYLTIVECEYFQRFSVNEKKSDKSLK